jgi:hypothetical protein
MSGHHAGHTPRTAAPADPLLDQLAQHVTLARASGNPAVDALAVPESAFTAGVLSRLEGLDATTIGAVLLAAGYYAGEYLKTVPPSADPRTAAGNAVNLLQLAGQQLYTSRVPSRAACTGTWPGGKRCKATFEAPTDEQLEAVIRGHMALNHPDQVAEEVAGAEETAYCACGKPAELIVGETNRPDGQPGTARAVCMDCARTGQYDGDTDGEAQA